MTWREASEIAVLNANYLLALLRRPEIAQYLPLAYGERCMHEFVLSGAPMKRDLGIRTTDLAKRLLDFGYHPPTVYFPTTASSRLTPASASHFKSGSVSPGTARRAAGRATRTASDGRLRGSACSSCCSFCSACSRCSSPAARIATSMRRT